MAHNYARLVKEMWRLQKKEQTILKELSEKWKASRHTWRQVMGMPDGKGKTEAMVALTGLKVI